MKTFDLSFTIKAENKQDAKDLVYNAFNIKLHGACIEEVEA
jgi:hypothetical protein